eukprot:GHVU01077504.1.p1 GENE.GHVU01077504.1~~GHVU01077504.1.p1  ORF type:complete len:122 (-),score=16.45 GHVU01077504.1:233-562(-)
MVAVPMAMPKEVNTRSRGKPIKTTRIASKLAACTECQLVQYEEQFLKDGCPNCSSSKQLTNDRRQANTTRRFKGLVVVMKPKESWLASTQRLGDMVPGCYAAEVFRGAI